MGRNGIVTSLKKDWTMTDPCDHRERDQVECSTADSTEDDTAFGVASEVFRELIQDGCEDRLQNRELEK